MRHLPTRFPGCKPLLVLPLALFAAACPGDREPDRPRLEPEFATNPPRVESSTVQLLDQPRDGSNAVLTVRFAADRRLGREVAIRPDTETVVLRDDGEEPDQTAGDRSFAAFLRVPPEELRASQQRLAAASQRNAVIPEFDRRRLVRRTSVREVAARERIDLQDARRIPVFFFGVPDSVIPERSLLVRDPGVIGDPTRTVDPCTGAGNPNGRWTFGYLATQMANQPATGLDPRVMVRRWLAQWQANQTVNGWTVARRPNIGAVIAEWEAASGGTGTLDLARAPFRLIAIVNRVDLRQNAVYGGNSGEGRFVFELVERRPGSCTRTRFTIILEYGVPLRGCRAVRSYGREWLILSGLTPGTAAYNNRLQAITERFARANAAPSKPNGSALNQLRSNEIHLARPWELREFVLDSSSHLLLQTTVKQEPGDTFNFKQPLAKWINDNAAPILDGSYVVPLNLPGGGNFLGGAAPTNGGQFWDGPPPHPSAQVTTPETRHLFSLGTCSGCHAGETSTPFQHINSSGISGFLTGITVPDPAGEPVPPRSFNDLLRRAADLDALVNTPCLAHIRFRPLNMVH